MAPIIRIFSVLFVTICIISSFPLENVFYGSLEMLAIYFSILLIILLAAIFGLEQLRNKFTGKASVYFDAITLVVSIMLISMLLFISGGAVSKYKVLFIPTILFYTVRFGLRWGITASAMTTITLAAANMTAFIQDKALNLELDIVYSGIFFLISWLVGSMVDMERAISDRLSVQVNVDSLTGLYNHHFLRVEIDRIIEEKLDAPFALMILDIDYFSYYKETRGNQAGDSLLVEVAEDIVDTIRGAGTVFRFGSEEFAVIVNQGDREKVIALAESVRKSIKDKFAITDSEDYWEYGLTASLGLSFYPADGSTRDDLITRAEQALYRAKVISGNKVETYFSVLEFLEVQVDPSEKEAFNKLTAFLAIINARDHYTYGHSERVLIYASIIADLIEMPPPAKRYLQYGAYLHDIGKIEIDRSILNFPGKLSDFQWEIIAQHPLWGANIARQIKALQPAIPSILYHHERYDGTGYPYKLSGKDIPIEGRIMALADSFDAMTVERPYRKAINFAEAILEIKSNRRIMFDPDIADRFIEFLGKYRSVDQLLTFKTKEMYLL